jgi:two-component system sensor histidine kinase EvgS
VENDFTIKKRNGPVRILVADCYRSNLVLMGHILSNFNCGHDFAKSGWEVLDKLEQGSFDLMFLECHPLEINGYAVVWKIRESKTHDGLKITGMASSQKKNQTGSRCANCGVDGFLDRPLGMWKIKNALKDDFPEVFGK